MQINKMKNMIVIENFASNVVEEAFVILKPNIKIEENKVETTKVETILKEAENIVTNYIDELQNKNKKSILEKSLERKCKILKGWNIFLIIFSILSIIISF